LQASPGDIFLFFTDGILEAQDVAAREFGYQMLEEVLTLHASQSAGVIRDSIAEAITKHTGQVKAIDDQTLIVLKVQSSEVETNNSVNLRLGTGELATAEFEIKGRI
jgi:sigma-B regulation protein RsbU (phosphoserine phosphatase)